MPKEDTGSCIWGSQLVPKDPLSTPSPLVLETLCKKIGQQKGEEEVAYVHSKETPNLLPTN